MKEKERERDSETEREREREKERERGGQIEKKRSTMRGIVKGKKCGSEGGGGGLFPANVVSFIW